jgi:hypothetical protein
VCCFSCGSCVVRIVFNFGKEDVDSVGRLHVNL